MPWWRAGADAAAHQVLARHGLAGFDVAVFSVSTLVEGFLGELETHGIAAHLRNGEADGDVIFGRVKLKRARATAMPVDVAGRQIV